MTYTDRFLSSLIALISIFRLPIAVVVTCINRQQWVVGSGVQRELLGMDSATSQTGDFCVVQSTWLEGQATVPTQLLHGNLSLIQMRDAVEHAGYMIRALKFAEVLLTCLRF